MKYFLDFDGVIFNVEALKAKMTELGMEQALRSADIFDAIKRQDPHFKISDLVYEDALRFLQQHAKDCHVVSSFVSSNPNNNTDERTQYEYQERKIKESGIAALLGAGAIHIVGESKSEMLEELHASCAKDKEKCVFVDDRELYMQEAHALGIFAVLMDRNGAFTHTPSIRSFDELEHVGETMPPVTVLLATGLYPPEIGGPATYARMLEEELPKHGIQLITVPFTRVRHLPKVVRHIAYAYKLWKKAKQADIVYALDPISVGLPALWVSFMRRLPFLLRLGGDYAWEQGQQRFGLEATLDTYTLDPKKAPFPVRALALLQAFTAKRAVRVIAPSNYLKGIIASWGVDPSSIEVIYSALFPLQVGYSKAEAQEALGFTSRTIISVGRLVPWKGFSELIDVFAKLQNEFADLRLLIVGDGPEEAALAEQIAHLRLSSAVTLAGRRDKQSLGEMIKASDLFVLNTSYEGLSHQLLEVMDLGVPIVTTMVGGNTELIEDGVSGLLVPVQDNEALEGAVRRLLQSEELCVRLTQNARVRTQRFHQDAVSAQVATLLHQIAKKDI